MIIAPGGHIEENEEPQDAVLREIEEETGLLCECLCYQPEFSLNLNQKIRKYHFKVLTGIFR